MTTPDRIKTVAVTAPDTLRIGFRSGKSYAVSLAAPMSRIAGFAVLRDMAEFNTATVTDDGWTVEWACGLSMASERLYQMAKEQAGEALPQDEFRDWMERNHLSLTTAADALSLSRRVVSQYSAGSRPIPKIVGLAIKGFEAERREVSA
ncbi:MAG: DUF2442 domain-containing protein [Nitrosomonadales bacterium]|nr:DUF2442 domain-containing protein [Nitrosomonadales bacterium]